MRVLACAFTCCPPGGEGFTGGEDVLGWNMLHQIARYHEVWVLTNSEDQHSIQDVLKDQSHDNIQFRYIGLPTILKPLLNIQGGHQFYYYIWQIRAYFAARRLHKIFEFQLFHHLTYGNDWMASYIGALLPVPYIRGPGGGAHRTPRSLQGEYKLGGRIWERIRSFGQWLFRHDPFFVIGQGRALAILVCNNDSAAKMPKQWTYKTHLFPVSGVSCGELPVPISVSDDNKVFQILSVGSLIRVKGFGLAIKAFRQFSFTYPNTQLTIIGNGPELANLRKMIDQTGLVGKVEIWPALPHDQLMDVMTACDVLLFPSMRDGGGTVVVEAMSLGKPVVCLDIAGPGMHINDQCGIKVSPGSSDATVDKLAEGLSRLYNDNSLRQRLGMYGRKRAEEHYEWDKLGERLLKIYDGVNLS